MLHSHGVASCGVGGASRDSAGFGAMEEGLISGKFPKSPHLFSIDRTSFRRPGCDGWLSGWVARGVCVLKRWM